jgi:hypothetical protein
MSWSIKDLEKLEKAYKTGATEVQYENNQKVRYRSLEEMRLLLNEARQQLGIIDVRATSNMIVPRFRR